MPMQVGQDFFAYTLNKITICIKLILLGLKKSGSNKQARNPGTVEKRIANSNGRSDGLTD